MTEKILEITVELDKEICEADGNKLNPKQVELLRHILGMSKNKGQNNV